jgi:hypothetical protein
MALSATGPDVLRPGDARYDAARRAWNLAADLRPAAVVRATSVDDVRAAVAGGSRIAALGCGHGALPLPALRDALLVRTELHRREPVSVGARVRIPAGTTWDAVVRAAAAQGVHVPHASAPSVGAVGFLLGGGLSVYARATGVAANHVRAIELVDADATHRRVDAATDPDLFWALRGGGGGFGIVTAIELDPLDVGPVYANRQTWPPAQAEEALATWVAWTQRAPPTATSTLRLTPAGVAVATTALHPCEYAWTQVEPTAVLDLHDEPRAPTPIVSTHALLHALDQATLLRHARAPIAAIELRHLGGALASAPTGAGVTGHVPGVYALRAFATPKDPSAAGAADAALQRLDSALHAASRRTRTLTESIARADCLYDPAAYARLIAAQRTWDPRRRFVDPYEIVPAAVSASTSTPSGMR